MRIAVFSNFLDHLVLPVCNVLIEKKDVEFTFVACERVPEDRVKMNYKDLNSQYDFVVRAYEDEEKAMLIATTYDAVIFGSAPLKYLSARMDLNLLTFRFCERSLKKGTWRRFIPRTRKKIYDGYIKYKDKPLYVLAAGAYVSSDLKLCGFDEKKCYSWGYFPEIKQNNISELFDLKKNNITPEVLYAGRLIGLKHAMDIVKAIHHLVNNGTEVHFTIIGSGKVEKEIKKYIQKNSLDKYISVMPFMTQEEVRAYMNKSDIYVMSSSFREGWGAVVNEAMNSACAVVASHAAGVTPFLIENGENGYIYRFSDIRDLSEKLSLLINDVNLRQQVGRNAYETVLTVWNSKIAGERLYNLCKQLLGGNACIDLYKTGPCSVSPIYSNNWFLE